MKNLEITLTYTRQERSKDNNGSNKTYTIKDNKLTYKDKYWGFKSGNIPVEEKSVNLTEEDIIEIFSFLQKNKFLKNINKKIRKPRVPYVIYNYELKITTEKDSFLITAQDSNKNKKLFIISIPKINNNKKSTFEKLDSFSDILKLKLA